LVLNFSAYSGRWPGTATSVQRLLLISVGVITVLLGGCLASNAVLSDDVGLSRPPSGCVK